jgi:hypothetical protein
MAVQKKLLNFESASFFLKRKLLVTIILKRLHKKMFVYIVELCKLITLTHFKSSVTTRF